MCLVSLDLKKIMAKVNTNFRGNTREFSLLVGALENCLKILNRKIEADEDITITFEKPKGHVLISYSERTRAIMLRLRKRLVAAGLQVCIDLADLENCDLPLSPPEVINDAAVVLVCYSNAYKKSAVRRCEAMQISKWKNPAQLLFVRAENNYVPDGWLGSLQGRKEVFDVASQLDNACESLIRQIKGIYASYLEIPRRSHTPSALLRCCAGSHSSTSLIKPAQSQMVFSLIIFNSSIPHSF